MQISLEGRSAIITGGSRGMGRAMALRFAEAGGDVAIVARRQSALDETLAEIEAVTNGRVAAVSCDVTDASAISDMFDSVNKKFGKVDILVNNAGTSSRGAFEDVTDEMWQADLDIKLFAAIRTCRLALPGMKERRWGRILNITTISAKAPAAGSAPTAVSRAAGMSLTKILANEGAPYNVLVNALCTGKIISDQVRRRHEKNRPDMTPEEYFALEGEKLPLGRLGDAEEYANMACFLASDAASYITGSAINIDGGLSPVV
jgi:3-oxoacyl-[acyl-carrier protein] reductase